MSTPVPHFTLARITEKGQDGPPLIVPVNALPLDVRCGRRGFLGAGLTVSAALATLGLHGCGKGRERPVDAAPETAAPAPATPPPLPAQGPPGPRLDAPPGARPEAPAAEEGVGAFDELPPNAHSAGIRALAMSPNQEYIASSSQDGVLKLWKRGQDQPLFACAAPGTVLAFSPDSRYLLFSARVKRTPEAEHEAASNKRLKWSLINPLLWVYDLQAGKPLGNYPVASQWVAFRAQGRVLGVYGSSPITGGDCLLRIPFLQGSPEEDPAGRSGFQGTSVEVPPVVVATLDAAAFVGPPGVRSVSLQDPQRVRFFDAAKALRENPEFAPAGLTVPPPASALAVSPSADIVAIGLPTGTVIVWAGETVLVRDALRVADETAAAGSTPARLWVGGGSPGVRALAVTRDGTVLVTGAHDGAVRLWALPSGEYLGLLGRHPAGVEAMALRGEFLATGDAQGFVRVWNVGRKELVKALRDEHDRMVLAPRTAMLAHRDLNALEFSPDSALLVTGSMAAFKAWDLVGGAKTAELSDLAGGGGPFAVSPDGPYLACIGSMPLADEAKKDPAPTGPARTPTDVVLRRVTKAVCFRVLPDLSVHAQLGSVPVAADTSPEPGSGVHGRDWQRLIFAAGGKALLVAAEDHALHAVALDGSGRHRPLMRFSSLGAMVGSGDRTAVAVKTQSASHPLAVAVLNAVDGRPIGEADTNWELMAVASEGSCLAGTNPAVGTELRALSQGVYKQAYTVSDPAADLAFTPDGKYCIACGKQGDLRVWAVPSCRLVTHQHDLPGLASARIAVSPDSSRLFIDRSDAVMILSLPDCQRLATLVLRYRKEAHPECLACSPDGTLLAVGDSDGVVSIWDLRKPRFVAFLFDPAVNGRDSNAVTYSHYDRETQTTITYTLPCGSPVPAGAVCTCNCVPGTWTPPSSGGHTICTCDLICTCLAVYRPG